MSVRYSKQKMRFHVKHKTVASIELPLELGLFDLAWFPARTPPVLIWGPLARSATAYGYALHVDPHGVRLYLFRNDGRYNRKVYLPPSPVRYTWARAFGKALPDKPTLYQIESLLRKERFQIETAEVSEEEPEVQKAKTQAKPAKKIKTVKAVKKTAAHFPPLSFAIGIANEDANLASDELRVGTSASGNKRYWGAFPIYIGNIPMVLQIGVNAPNSMTKGLFAQPAAGKGKRAAKKAKPAVKSVKKAKR